MTSDIADAWEGTSDGTEAVPRVLWRKSGMELQTLTGREWTGPSCVRHACLISDTAIGRVRERPVLADWPAEACRDRCELDTE